MTLLYHLELIDIIVIKAFAFGQRFGRIKPFLFIRIAHRVIAIFPAPENGDIVALHHPLGAVFTFIAGKVVVLRHAINVFGQVQLLGGNGGLL